MTAIDLGNSYRRAPDLRTGTASVARVSVRPIIAPVPARSLAGVTSDYQYDLLSRLDKLVQVRDGNNNGIADPGEDVLAEFDYDLLADGRRSGVTETDDQGRTTRIDWRYDNLGRLTREVYDSYDSALDFTTDYLFDLASNRLAKSTDHAPTPAEFTTYRTGGALNPDEAISYRYDSNDRLVWEKLDTGANGSVDQVTSYAYGPNADFTDAANPYAGDGTQQTGNALWAGGMIGVGRESHNEYRYNLQGRMAAVEIDSDGNTDLEERVEYRYDANGIRVGQTITEDTDGDGSLADETPTETKFLVDGQNPTGYAQVLEEKDAAGQVQKSHTLGLDVTSQALYTGAVHFLLYDGHGSTRMLVDALGYPLSGQVYRYDAYGNPLGFSPTSALTSLLYSGEWLDRLTNLQYLRARYYDPSTGRFNRLDPFFGNLQDPQSLHKYAYVHGDPIGRIDPSGEMTLLSTTSALRTLMNMGALMGGVIGSAWGAVRGFFDEYLAREATWESILSATLMGAVWGGATGLVFGYMMPWVAAAGGPWGVAAVGAGGALYAGYNTYNTVHEAWALGNEKQAIYRACVGTIETVMSLFAAQRALAARYGAHSKYVLYKQEGTPLPGPKTMAVLRTILRAAGIRDIILDESLPVGTGRYDGSRGTISIHPQSGFSVLVHEIMHGLHHDAAWRAGKNWFEIPKSGPHGKEQAAFSLVYKLFGKFMTRGEVEMHAEQLRLAGGNPTLVHPNL